MNLYQDSHVESNYDDNYNSKWRDGIDYEDDCSDHLSKAFVSSLLQTWRTLGTTTRMFSGKTASTFARSQDSRLRTRPKGVVSKKDIGLRSKLRSNGECSRFEACRQAMVRNVNDISNEMTEKRA